MDVHPADIQDRDGGIALAQAAAAKFPTLAKLWADSGYSRKFIEAVQATTKLVVEVVKRPGEGRQSLWTRDGETPLAPVQPTGFVVVRWRWIVERTLAWMSRNRRLSKDYEETIASSKAWMTLAMIRLITARLGAE